MRVSHLLDETDDVSIDDDAESQISPELVLVDPELRARLLAQLEYPWPVTPDSLAPTPMPSAPPIESDVATHARSRGASLFRFVALSSLLLNVFFVSNAWSGSIRPAAVVASTGSGSDPAVPSPTSASTFHARTSPFMTSTTVVRPATGAVTLAWRPVRGAAYYDLVLWRGHRRILDLWPTTPTASIPSSWRYQGRSGSMVPGRYLWFVYPGFGSRAAGRFGGNVQSGILEVKNRKAEE